MGERSKPAPPGRAHADGEALALARELIAIDTINPPGREARAAAVVGARLERAGLHVREHALGTGRSSLVARWPGRGDRPALCISGHLDTVPLGAERWTHDPFGGELDGDRLYGRGASDMKAGVAAIVVAAERLAARGRGNAGLEIVLCAGEETGCEGALALAQTPGALGEVGALGVAEPTSNAPHIAHKGVVWLDAVADGRTAHGSMPHLGDNAVHKLARAVVRLEDVRLDAPPHALLGGPTLSVGTFAGGLNVNSVPDSACAAIDVRTVPGLTAAAVVEQIGAVTEPDVRLQTRLALDPVDSDPADPWVVESVDVIGGLRGELTPPGGLAYFTDAAALTPAYGGPPTVICGPGDAEQAHRTDESCSIAALALAAEAYFELALRWCGL